jgi:hypothetical protein
VWVLGGAYPLGRGFDLQGGFAAAYNHPPGGPATATWGNPLVAVAYHARPRPDVRLVPIVGGLAPLARGGGNHPDPAVEAANTAGALTRSGYNGGIFTPNEAAVGAGLDAAWAIQVITLQAEVIVADLIRVRGEEVLPEAHRPFGSAALFVGGWVRAWLSGGAELRYIGFLLTPEEVKQDPASREQTSVEIGLRAHLPLAGSVMIHPGLSYARGLDPPMTRLGFQVWSVAVAVDFP